MPVKTRSVNTTFHRGVLAPELRFRFDTEGYAAAAAALTNMRLLKGGAATRRPGTLHRATIADAVRGAPFVFSEDQTYAVVFGEARLSIFTVSDDAFTRIDLTAPWDATQAGALHWTQSGDVMIITHQAVPVQKLTRTGATTFTLEDLTYTSAPRADGAAAFGPETGYPRTAVFHDQRLWFAGTPTWRAWIWGSKIGEFFNFSAGSATDQDAIVARIADDQVNDILHLHSHRGLQIFTDGGEYAAIQGATGTLTPGTMNARSQTPYGSVRRARPAAFDGATLFCQAGGGDVREFIYQDDQQSLDAPSVAVLSEHLINDPIQLSVLHGSRSIRENYAFLTLADGDVAVFHSIRSEAGVAGWTPWTTAGRFLSVFVVARRLFAVVARPAGTFLEEFDPGVTVDCGLQLTNAVTDAGGTHPAPTETWTVPHLPDSALEGVSLPFHLGSAPSDSAGTVTFAGQPAAAATVGLNFAVTIVPLSPEFSLRDGTTAGRKRRITRLGVDVLETLSFRVDRQTVWASPVTLDPHVPPPARTGMVWFRLLGWHRGGAEGARSIRSTAPVPMTVRGIVQEVAL